MYSNKNDTDEDKTLYADDGTPIKWLKKTPDTYVDYTTLVLGSSGSGKTKIIEEILYLCRDKFPNYLLITPESTYTKFYAHKFPRICWKEDLTKEKLIEIWQRQERMTQIYNIANDAVVLEKLFLRIQDRDAIAKIKICIAHTNIKIDKVDRTEEFDHSQKKDVKNFLIDKKDKKIKEIYKETIDAHRAALSGKSLSVNEQIALEFLLAKPKLCIVIDDCTENLQKWQKYFKKNEENIFERIFFRGRHVNITMIIASHDDGHISPPLRKNLRNCIFTDSKLLNSMIERANNGFSKTEKETIKKMAHVIFNDTDKIKTHKKLCYIREDTTPYQYTIANLYPEFSLTNKALMQLINKMPKKTDQIENNPYLKDIVVQKSKRKSAPSNTVSKPRKYLLQ